MICIFCNKKIDKYKLASIFIEDDLLCYACREKLKIRHKYVDVGKLKVETFYEYDGMFKDLLIQYKECYDEALKDVFLYMLKDYIKFKYFAYKIVLMPSSRQKLLERGFNHLELIFKSVGLDIVWGLNMKDELIQEGKNHEERQKMITNYYYDGPKLDKVLIVDDVMTTGSSMIGAYMALSGSCNKIRSIALSYKKKTLTF